MKKPTRAVMVDEILAATAAEDRPRITLELAKLTNITARWEKARRLTDPSAPQPQKRGPKLKGVGAWWLESISALKAATGYSDADDASDAWRDGADDRAFVEQYFAPLRREFQAGKPLTAQWITHVTESGEHMVYDLRGGRAHTKLTLAHIRSPDPKGVMVEIQREITSICHAISTERSSRLRAEQVAAGKP